MTHHVIYIPGLGDHRSYAQNKFIKFWKVFGLKTHYFRMSWRSNQPFSVRMGILLDKIEKLSNKGDQISLVGVSAGASAAIYAFAQNPKNIVSVVLICGKINNPQTIWKIRYQQNPGFEESMKLVAGSLKRLGPRDRAKILSIHPWRDTVVPPGDTKISGAINKTLPGWGHLSGIALGLILGTPKIVSFFHNKAKN